MRRRGCFELLAAGEAWGGSGHPLGSFSPHGAVSKLRSAFLLFLLVVVWFVVVLVEGITRFETMRLVDVQCLLNFSIEQLIFLFIGAIIVGFIGIQYQNRTVSLQLSVMESENAPYIFISRRAPIYSLKEFGDRLTPYGDVN